MEEEGGGGSSASASNSGKKCADATELCGAGRGGAGGRVEAVELSANKSNAALPFSTRIDFCRPLPNVRQQGHGEEQAHQEAEHVGKIVHAGKEAEGETNQEEH